MGLALAIFLRLKRVLGKQTFSPFLIPDPSRVFSMVSLIATVFLTINDAKDDEKNTFGKQKCDEEFFFSSVFFVILSFFPCLRPGLQFTKLKTS